MVAEATTWTAMEEARLRELYPRASWSALLAALPGRSKRACWNRAHKLGLRRLVKEDPPGHREALAQRMREKPLRTGKVLYPVIKQREIPGKFCSECREWKPLRSFSKQQDCSGGVRNICTTCEGRVSYARNPEKRKAAVRRYQKNHPEQHRLHKQASQRKRHGRIIEGPGVSTVELRELLHLFGGLCAYCRVASADTFDHVTPLSRGGRHEAKNILPACKACNFEKHDKTLEEWTAHRAEREG